MKIFLYIFLILISFTQKLISADIQQIQIVHLNRVMEREPTIYSINPEVIDNGI